MSPLELLENPRRKTRSETMLRLLISTSYPHATVGNIARLLVESDKEYVEQLAEQIRDFEKGLTPFDFIRQVRIRRDNKSLGIQCRRGAKLMDSTSLHEVDANLENLVDLGLSLEQRFDVDRLANYLTCAFYNVRSKGQRVSEIPEGTQWLMKHKVLKQDPNAEGLGIRKETVTEPVGTDEVLRTLNEQLSRQHFQVHVTTTGISTHYGAVRFWLKR